MEKLFQKLEMGWKKLVSKLNTDSQVERQLLEALQRDYFEEKSIGELLEKESGRIPYSHLRKKLLDIARAEKHHADLLAEKIKELGGQIPEHAMELKNQRQNRQFTSTLDLLKLLEEEKDEYVEYINTAYLAEDAGRKDLKALLMKIGEEERRHRKELMDILSRLNPLPAS